MTKSLDGILAWFDNCPLCKKFDRVANHKCEVIGR